MRNLVSKVLLFAEISPFTLKLQRSQSAASEAANFRKTKMFSLSFNCHPCKILCTDDMLSKFRDQKQNVFFSVPYSFYYNYFDGKKEYDRGFNLYSLNLNECVHLYPRLMNPGAMMLAARSNPNSQQHSP